MATIRIYTHPSGNLDSIAQGVVHLVANETGLNFIADYPRGTISIALNAADLKILLTDLSLAIARHEFILDHVGLAEK